MNRLPQLTDLDVRGKRILLRVDFNIPLEQGNITNTARIDAILPTIEYLQQAGCSAVLIMSHLGRPTEGQFDVNLSLAPVADYLSTTLNQTIPLIQDWQTTTVNPNLGDIILLENVRFCVGEKANDPALAQHIATLADIYIMDAFSIAHRKQASTYGVMQYAPLSCAGPLLIHELTTLAKALKQPDKPVLAIVGGSKISTKLPVLKHLTTVVDQLIVGGGIANTCIAAMGHSIGNSLYEPELLGTARDLLETAQQHNTCILLPTDMITATQCAADASTETKHITHIADHDMILDIGPETAQQYATFIQAAATILWNGPVGVFELAPFAAGTHAIAQAISLSSAFSVAGGGDTIAAIDKFYIREYISYISTGGGAFLAYLQGEPLPVVALLETIASQT